MQLDLKFESQARTIYPPLKSQLLKWIGNKQRFSNQIISFFPNDFKFYYEPFLGSGAILANLAPKNGIGSDIFKPLIEIWKQLKSNPDELINWYTERYNLIEIHTKEKAYDFVKNSYNNNPNGADFLFLSRACYGGVIRFRQTDGYMSTPCGVHNPMKPIDFKKRVNEWHLRIKYSNFYNSDFRDVMKNANKGDLIYCDPPYSYCQGIVYGAQSFKLENLLNEIEKCKSKGVYVVLSIDGTKKSGNYICNLSIPKNLFKREVEITVGRSMLRRFQMNGKTLEKEHVTDRLLLTY